MLLCACSQGAVRKSKETLASFHLPHGYSFQVLKLVGKGGSIITEMRKVTNANICILSKDLPKIASDNEEMVLISGELDISKDALIQLTSCLRANLFEKEGAVSAFLPVLPYVPMQMDDSDRLDYESSRDGKSRGHGYSSYSSRYGGFSDLPPVNTYGGYGGHESGSPALRMVHMVDMHQDDLMVLGQLDVTLPRVEETMTTRARH